MKVTKQTSAIINELV